MLDRSRIAGNIHLFSNEQFLFELTKKLQVLHRAPQSCGFDNHSQMIKLSNHTYNM